MKLKTQELHSFIHSFIHPPTELITFQSKYPVRISLNMVEKLKKNLDSVE